ncbi:MAG: MarR family transcriptional regulator [Oscillibacter sp.]|nr:MarR family transcriptional regulator [uncultured Oscillibacter sp.]MCI8969926.1 MarR family transcriptional regulator [Oscillibacter sp.]
MSLPDCFTALLDQFYNMERIITAIEKQPKTYEGVSLHANESHTLKLIAQSEGISQADLSERMYRTKGATSIAVDKLVKKGLIRREREEGNQRRYLLTLTGLGWRVHEAHLRYDAANAEWAAGLLDLTEQDLETTIRTLDRVITLYSRRYLKNGVYVSRGGAEHGPVPEEADGSLPEADTPPAGEAQA